MSFSEISTLVGAAISAIAVLVSLLLVQRQLRQAHKNQQALIQQGRASRSAEIAMRLMSTDFAEAYHNCMRGDAQVTEIQLVQFIGYSRAVFLGAEDSFLQHRDGLLDKPAFTSFSRSLSSLFESPGMRGPPGSFCASGTTWSSRHTSTVSSVKPPTGRLAFSTRDGKPRFPVTTARTTLAQPRRRVTRGTPPDHDCLVDMTWTQIGEDATRTR